MKDEKEQKSGTEAYSSCGRELKKRGVS